MRSENENCTAKTIWIEATVKLLKKRMSASPNDYEVICMETINGEWIMKGCDPSDPEVLQSPEDAISMIRKIGFLPLFSNAIPGFSIEEHVPADRWWTGDPITDPWEWRIILASHPDIAYGKFFHRAAGFISKDFFPYFANYRRNGYDFDALFEDELASFRSKKIMDAFETDDDAVGKELMTYQIRDLAGFGKKAADGQSAEKNFEGALTDLQMQTYLILSDFRQKKNKKGQAYGWHIAAVETPETKWGREHVASAYGEDPSESWVRMVNNVNQHFPEAGGNLIQKVLGIKYPGGSMDTTASSPQKKASKKKTTVNKKIRPQQLSWPENLVTEIGLEEVFGKKEYSPLTDDQIAGLRYAVSTLKDKEREILLLRYEEHSTYKAIANRFGLSNERIRQICAKAVRKTRHPSRLRYLKDGYQGAQEIERLRKEELKNACEGTCSARQISLLKTIEVGDAGFSVRTYNILWRSNVYTLGQVVEMMQEDIKKITELRNLGRKGILEIVEKLEKYNVNCKPLREYCFTASARTLKLENIDDLGLSIRTYNAVKRAGINTVEEIKNIIENNPERIGKIRNLGIVSQNELFDVLKQYGVDCRKARNCCTR